MLTFFKKIRQNKLSKGKSGMYLKYAIGEIVLVVIGILIALQINNWNELRKDRDKEQVLLRQLNEEYQKNLIQLDEKITIRNAIIESASRLLKMMDDPSLIEQDSILYFVSLTRMSPTFDPIENDLINGGELDLIQDGDLRSMLTAWASDVQQLKEAEVKWINVLEQFFKPLIYHHNVVRNVVIMNAINGSWELMSINSDISEGMESVNFGVSEKYNDNIDALFKDKKLESILSWAVGVNTYNNYESFALREHIEAILNSIDKDLKPVKSE